jgi:adenylate kinase
MGTIFVGGVHGVGKTDVCTRVSNQLTLSHFTASAMIKALDSSAVKQHTKSVDSVPKNQDLLVQAVAQFYSSGTSRLILDGHFAVPNIVSQFEIVSADIFKQLQLDGVAVCFDDASQIHARRISRDKSSVGIQEIEGIQRIELEHGKFVAKSLGIPFFKVKAFDTDALLRFVCWVWQLKPHC